MGTKTVNENATVCERIDSQTSAKQLIGANTLQIHRQKGWKLHPKHNLDKAKAQLLRTDTLCLLVCHAWVWSGHCQSGCLFWCVVLWWRWVWMAVIGVGSVLWTDVCVYGLVVDNNKQHSEYSLMQQPIEPIPSIQNGAILLAVQDTILSNWEQECI